MKKLSILFVFLAGCLWGGFMGIFVRLLTDAGFSHMEIAFLRSVGTVLLFAPILLVRDRSLFRIRLKDVWCFAGTGIASITFFNFCYFYAIEKTSLSVAAVLLYTSPIFVLTLSALFFHEPITKQKLFALSLCLIGCTLVSGVFSEGRFTFLGILAGVGAGLGYALYSVFSRAALARGYQTLTVLFYTFLFSSVTTALFIDVPHAVTLLAPSPRLWLLALLLSVVVTVAPYLFFTVGLNYIENGTASIVASVEPVAATLTGILLYHEIPTGLEILGILLVLTAIALLNLPKKETSQ